ncbi:hypothetical protein CDAR_267731 [Caerostris darwini]|uniref:Uncharacterized protein n=1 Tax=Caerostris darwini TaxID=1538125 RepID=A0AAV4RPM3_9ARAC|nr:hypothetical protein CDAR_267731 [Caerostris darwini]
MQELRFDNSFSPGHHTFDINLTVLIFEKFHVAVAILRTVRKFQLMTSRDIIPDCSWLSNTSLGSLIVRYCLTIARIFLKIIEVEVQVIPSFIKRISIGNQVPQ